jgi:hypothetical protein
MIENNIGEKPLKDINLLTDFKLRRMKDFGIRLKTEKNIRLRLYDREKQHEGG